MYRVVNVSQKGLMGRFVQADYRTKPLPPFGRVFDLDRAKEIPNVVFFDELSGDYEAWDMDEQGRVHYEGERIKTIHGRCRLKFIPFDSTDGAA